jgi:hypothetical protein
VIDEVQCVTDRTLPRSLCDLNFKLRSNRDQRSTLEAILDVFDAVVSRRCYKKACSLDTALAILDEDSGKHFDPDVVRAFMSVLPENLKSYPTLQAS